MQVERFFHLRQGPKGGATVRVIGDPDRVGQVDVQFSRCSRSDMFCKKTGRDLAASAPVKVVPLRYLPAELQRIHDKCKVGVWGQDYSFSLKYFLPKE